MNWVCSVCGLENSTDTFTCVECGAKYGQRQNGSIDAKRQAICKRSKPDICERADDTTAQSDVQGHHEDIIQGIRPIDIAGVNWGRPVAPAIGQASPVSGPIPFSIKIASVVALVCMIFSILLMLR